MERTYLEQLQKIEASVEQRFGQMGRLQNLVAAATDRARGKRIEEWAASVKG